MSDNKTKDAPLWTSPALLDAGLPPIAFYLVCYVLRRSNGGRAVGRARGVCDASFPTIGRDCGKITERIVRRYVKQLVGAGILERVGVGYRGAVKLRVNEAAIRELAAQKAQRDPGTTFRGEARRPRNYVPPTPELRSGEPRNYVPTKDRKEGIKEGGGESAPTEPAPSSSSEDSNGNGLPSTSTSQADANGNGSGEEVTGAGPFTLEEVVFDYWRMLVPAKAQERLTAHRRAAIRERLAMGATVEECRFAFRGVVSAKGKERDMDDVAHLCRRFPDKWAALVKAGRAYWPPSTAFMERTPVVAAWLAQRPKPEPVPAGGLTDAERARLVAEQDAGRERRRRKLAEQEARERAEKGAA